MVPVPNLSHLEKHNLSQWDRQIGTGCACPTGTGCTCPSGIGTLPVPNLSHRDWERSKETCSCPMDRSYTHAGGLSLSQDRPYAHDGTCPSPTCPNLSHKVGLQGRGTLQSSLLPEPELKLICSNVHSGAAALSATMMLLCCSLASSSFTLRKSSFHSDDRLNSRTRIYSVR